MPQRTKAKISAPKGTRDLYPLEAARRRFLTETWRRTAINHGFEEIDGPTFETLDLYTVKSGEGIVSELFQAYSGKSPDEVEQVQASGKAPFALRPEFTPTLARMYGAKANALPKPTKWFSIGPYFRAERPQRGRLREFLQWNVDVLGDQTPPEGTHEVIACCIGALEAFGLGPDVVRVKVSSRSLVEEALRDVGVSEEHHEQAFALLDKRAKVDPEKFRDDARAIGLDVDRFDERMSRARVAGLDDVAHAEWLDSDTSIVRGLAYYTGTVFEVVAEGERAVAGGGEYDELIELFGGPATPAVGFAMGDVVLANLLQDRGLMPDDDELMARIGARPDVFVIAATEDADRAAAGVMSRLRAQGLHARRSYKSTRKVGKLLGEAASQHARAAVVLESAAEATVKLLDGAEQERIPVASVVEWALTRLETSS